MKKPGTIRDKKDGTLEIDIDPKAFMEYCTEQTRQQVAALKTGEFGKGLRAMLGDEMVDRMIATAEEHLTEQEQGLRDAKV